MQVAVPNRSAVRCARVLLTAPATFFAVTVNVYAVLGLSPVTFRLEHRPDADRPPLLAVTVQAAIPPPAFTLNVTVAVLNVADEPVIVTTGAATVRAVAVAGSLAPASLTAVTCTDTVFPLPNPVTVAAVAPAATSVERPAAVTTYRVIGRPFSAGAVQVTRTAPAWPAT